MTDEETVTRETLRAAIDDSVLTHTGRSIGDLASQRVVDDIWPIIEAREAALVEIVRAVATEDYAEDVRALLAQNEQAMEIVRAVANIPDSEYNVECPDGVYMPARRVRAMLWASVDVRQQARALLEGTQP